MGSTYSVDDLQERVYGLKFEVEHFEGTMASKEYTKLQGKLIKANITITKIKKFNKGQNSKEYDKMLSDLNVCLTQLTRKVTQIHNKTAMEETKPQEIEEPPSIRRPKKDAAATIEQYEKEVEIVENEIEKADLKQLTIIEAKLRLIYTQLAITKIERRSSLDARRNAMFRKIVHCYKRIKKGEINLNDLFGTESDLVANLWEKTTSSDIDSDFDSDFDSEFDKSDWSRTASMRSSIHGETESENSGNLIPHKNSQIHIESSKMQAENYYEDHIYENIEIVLQEKRKIMEEKTGKLEKLADEKDRRSYQSDESSTEDFYKDFEKFVKSSQTSHEKLKGNKPGIRPTIQKQEDTPSIECFTSDNEENRDQEEQTGKIRPPVLKQADDTEFENFSSDEEQQPMIIKIHPPIIKNEQDEEILDDISFVDSDLDRFSSNSMDLSSSEDSSENNGKFRKKQKVSETKLKVESNRGHMQEGLCMSKEVDELKNLPEEDLTDFMPKEVDGIENRAHHIEKSDEAENNIDHISEELLSCMSEEVDEIENLLEGDLPYFVSKKVDKTENQGEETHEAENISENIPENLLPCKSKQADDLEDHITQTKKHYIDHAEELIDDIDETEDVLPCMSKEEDNTQMHKHSQQYVSKTVDEKQTNIQYESNEEVEEEDEDYPEALNLELLNKRRAYSGRSLVYRFQDFESHPSQDKEDVKLIWASKGDQEHRLNYGNKLHHEPNEDHESFLPEIPKRNMPPSTAKNKGLLKVEYRPTSGRKTNRRGVVPSIDCTQQIVEIFEAVEDLKAMNKVFQTTKDYKVYAEIQEKLMNVIKSMFNMNKVNFDKKSLILYDNVSKDIQTFVNEL